MGLIADILLVAGALGATFYCFVLSRRLSRFNDLERGVGGAVAVLSVQVDDMTKTLERAEVAARTSTNSLEDLTGRADGAARRLELLVAAMHDLPESASPRTEPAPVAQGTQPDIGCESDLPKPDPTGEIGALAEIPNPTDIASNAQEEAEPDASVAQPAESASEAMFVRHRTPVTEAAE